MSESLYQLRNDAKWWIENSAGMVNIILTIWIRKAAKTLYIEKYIPGLPPSLAATVVIDRTASPTNVTGAPLVLEFDRLFDRQPNLPLERNLVLTMQDLQSWGDAY